MSTKHKHRYEIHAWADGWKLEAANNSHSWVAAKHPTFGDEVQYRVVPDEDGWLPWYSCAPIPTPSQSERVELLLGDGHVVPFCWLAARRNVVAYRVVRTEPKTVKMWRWVMVDKHGTSFLTTAHYANEADARNTKWVGAVRAVRADWTEIEVPV